ncbi:MAG: hypothetical protein HZA37_02670 [Parcubacteria group bacterium]|nr:hypothetical protein [Parcubacteria group bacterium]
MRDFILQFAFLTGIAAIIYVISRAVPRVNETEGESKNAVDRWLASLPLEKADVIISASVEKILRRLKVTIMRFDNALNKHIGRIKEKTGSGFSRPTFKEMTESPDGETEGETKSVQSERDDEAPR